MLIEQVNISLHSGHLPTRLIRLLRTSALRRMLQLRHLSVLYCHKEMLMDGYTVDFCEENFFKKIEKSTSPPPSPINHFCGSDGELIFSRGILISTVLLFDENASVIST